MSGPGDIMAPRELQSGETHADRPEFKLLIENNADGIVVIDRSGTVLFVNPAAERIFNRPAAKLIGSPIGVPVLVGETTEITLMRPGAEPLDTEMRVVETTWSGKPALVASLRDITTRRLTEERLRQAQKMEAVGQLTAGIAHDFNNLLTVAAGNLELLHCKLSSQPELRKSIDAALGALLRAEKLTAQLLAFSRKQRLAPRPIDVNRVLIGMEDLLRRTVGDTIELRYAMATALPPALADGNQLETALLNLVLNARDAMPDGGALTLETSMVDLDMGYLQEHPESGPGRYITVSVTDTGKGMPPDVLKHVFEPFFSTKEPGRGTGLGLAMVDGFVSQSGGHVRIESAPGEGTRVTLHLPVAQFDQGVEDANEDEVPFKLEGGTETVLVVEDDSAVRAFACSALRSLGYRVLEAPDGRAALGVLSKHPVDVVFSDIVMPGDVNGLELAKTVMVRRPTAKVILTSGYSSRFTDRDGVLSVVEFLRKPYRPAEIAQRFRKVLGRHMRGEKQP